MRVLHLVQDEKFIDFYFGVVSPIRGVSHLFLVQTASKDKPLVHLRHTPVHRRVNDGYIDSPEMRHDLSNADVLIIHFMTSLGLKLIRRVLDRTKVVWSGWGADYYHLLPGGTLALLDKDTRKAFIKSSRGSANAFPLIDYVSDFAKDRLRPLRDYLYREKHWMPAIERVDFFSSPINYEYHIIKDALGKRFSASFVQINYGSVDSTFSVGVSDVSGDNILIGNSAAPTNNHIDVMNQVTNISLGDRKVIVPLSYGDASYRVAVLEKGKYLFGDKFMPLLDFMSLDEYNRITSSCSVALMGHWRQQGIGNIGALMWAGAGVFLDKKNVLYSFLIDSGAILFDVSSFGMNACHSHLSRSSVEKNRAVLLNKWAGSVVNENAARLFMHVL